jgi:uncharacterized RDD family membrane protein YckC
METAFDAPAPPPAGFWIRFAAALIDWLVLFAAELVLGFVAGLVWGGDIAESEVFKVTITVFMLTLTSVYYVVLHAALGQTVGKMATRIGVVRMDGGPVPVGAAMVRYAGYWVSALPLLIGYLMVGVRQDKRALHDLMARTRVIRLG